MRLRLFYISITILALAGLFGPMPIQANDNDQTNITCPTGCVCVCSEPELEPEPKAPVFTMVISELLPDPEGNDADGEFIELMNLGPDVANLDGWQIQIGTKYFDLSGITMAPNSHHYWLYSETKLYLSNTGKTVDLLNADGEISDTVTYPTAKTGQSYSQTSSGLFEWTLTPTPGSPNNIVVEHPEASSDNDDSNSTNATNETQNNQTDTTANPEPVAEENTEPEMSLPLTTQANIVINEFLPDPEGSDSTEWIELLSKEQAEINLNGWVLDDIDGGSTPFKLDGYKLDPNGILLINKADSGLALNNGGDEVRLLNPNEEMVDSVTYQEAPTGKSFTLSEDNWYWSSEPTPGQINTAQLPNSDESEDEMNLDSDELSDLTSTDDNDSDQEEKEEFEEVDELVPISELPDMEDGTLVTVEGMVSLPLNLIGKTIFMLEDQTDAAGAEARLYGKDRPELMPGQWVTVKGRVSHSGDDWRLNVITGGLSVSEAQTPPVPIVIEPGLIDQKHNGLTISIIGIVTSKNGRRLKITDISGEPRIDVSMLGTFDIPGKIGDEVEVMGVVRWRKDEAEIIVPERVGLKIKKMAPEISEEKEDEHENLTGTGLTLPTNNQKPTSGWMLALAGASTAGMLTMGWLNWKKTQNQTNT